MVELIGEVTPGVEIPKHLRQELPAQVKVKSVKRKRVKA